MKLEDVAIRTWNGEPDGLPLVVEAKRERSTRRKSASGVSPEPAAGSTRQQKKSLRGGCAVKLISQCCGIG